VVIEGLGGVDHVVVLVRDLGLARGVAWDVVAENRAWSSAVPQCDGAHHTTI
jgi:hypothetical protein